MAGLARDVFVNGKADMAIASLPATLLLAALPHWYTIAKAETNKVQGGWGNENPRAFVARLNAKAAQGKRLSKLEELILRGQSAQQNGFEWWAVWAIAVVLGHMAKLPKDDLNRFTVIHVTARILYYLAYVFLESRPASLLRTAVFQFSIYPAIAIFFKAARALN